MRFFISRSWFGIYLANFFFISKFAFFHVWGFQHLLPGILCHLEWNKLLIPEYLNMKLYAISHFRRQRKWNYKRKHAMRNMTIRKTTNPSEIWHYLKTSCNWYETLGLCRDCVVNWYAGPRVIDWLRIEKHSTLAFLLYCKWTWIMGNHFDQHHSSFSTLSWWHKFSLFLQHSFPKNLELKFKVLEFCKGAWKNYCDIYHMPNINPPFLGETCVLSIAKLLVIIMKENAFLVDYFYIIFELKNIVVSEYKYIICTSHRIFGVLV